jgi:hypothetical protein
MDSLASGLRAWTPVWIRTAGAPVVDWAVLGGPIADPFFEQTAEREMRHPFNQLFARETPLGALEEIAAAEPSVPPSGFVFHMSRCGSTLVAQMLAGLPSSIVLSEAQPFAAVLELHRERRLGDDAAAGALRGLAAALGRPRYGETRLFVKFHASHVLDLPLIARAFPGVPWVFLFREPRAVLRSHARALGAETFAAASGDVPDERNAESAVAAYCEAALRHAGVGSSLFVDYAELPGAVCERILPFFGVELDDGAADALRAIARRDTKRPGDFTARADAGEAPNLDALAVPRLDPAYAALKRRAARAA